MPRKKRRKGWDAQTRGGPVTRYYDPLIAKKPIPKKAPVKTPIKERIPGTLYLGDEVELVFIDRSGKRTVRKGRV